MPSSSAAVLGVVGRRPETRRGLKEDPLSEYLLSRLLPWLASERSATADNSTPESMDALTEESLDFLRGLLVARIGTLLEIAFVDCDVDHAEHVGNELIDTLCELFAEALEAKPAPLSRLGLTPLRVRPSSQA
jgi:hypothetical protein